MFSTERIGNGDGERERERDVLVRETGLLFSAESHSSFSLTLSPNCVKEVSFLVEHFKAEPYKNLQASRFAISLPVSHSNFRKTGKFKQGRRDFHKHFEDEPFDYDITFYVYKFRI